MITTNRISTGTYQVADGDRAVTIKEKGGRWQAFASWDRFLYTALLSSKREAMANAKWMLVANVCLRHG
jgi:predicted Zn-dependent peptidase